MKLLLSVFVLGGRGASQLPGCEGGRGASQLWSCVVLFCGKWRRVSFRGGEGGQSALELGVKLLLSVFVLGGRGASQLPAVKGEGGRVSFGVGCETVAVCFCFGGAGGQSASGCVCVCGEWRRVSFRGGEGASQLWSCV